MGSPRLLAQSSPSATTATTLYTAANNNNVEITRLYVCNRAGAGGTFRVAIVRVNESLANKAYLYYDAAIGANTTITLENITLGAGDIISIYASSGDQSFNLFGSENVVTE